MAGVGNETSAMEYRWWWGDNPVYGRVYVRV